MRSAALLRRPSAWSHDYRDATALDALTPTESTRRLLIPTRRVQIALGALFAAGVLAWFVPVLASAWIGITIVLVLIAASDAYQLLRVPGIYALDRAGKLDALLAGEKASP